MSGSQAARIWCRYTTGRLPDGSRLAYFLARGTDVTQAYARGTSRRRVRPESEEAKLARRAYRPAEAGTDPAGTSAVRPSSSTQAHAAAEQSSVAAGARSATPSR